MWGLCNDMVFWVFQSTPTLHLIVEKKSLRGEQGFCPLMRPHRHLNLEDAATWTGFLLTTKFWWLVGCKWFIRGSVECGSTLWMFEHFEASQILKWYNVLFVGIIQCLLLKTNKRLLEFSTRLLESNEAI